MSIGLSIGSRLGSAGNPVAGPVFRSLMTRASLTGTSATVTKDAFVQNGDLLIACIAVLNVEAVTAPAGWTLIAETKWGTDTVHFITYYKVAASEGASWVWSWTSSVAYNGFVAAYREAHPTTPFGSVTTNPNQASAGTSTALTLTPDRADSLVVTVHAVSTNRTFTAPTGLLERADVGTGPSTSLNELVPWGMSAVGNRASTLSAASGSAAQMIAFRPKP